MATTTKTRRKPTGDATDNTTTATATEAPTTEAPEATAPAAPNLQVLMIAAALEANPAGITGAEVATTSGLQPGVVGRVLAAMEATSTARRLPPPDGDESDVERWTRGEVTDLATVDPANAPTHTVCHACGHKRRIVVNVGGARRNGSAEPGLNSDGSAKFRKNELYGMVRDLVTSRPGHVFTYGDLARELGEQHGRTISTGATRNAQDRLLAEGVLVRANPHDPHDQKVTLADGQPAAG